ncbi:hypothetical protein SNE40_014056 [Patella caerulea]|uniref:Uncharacterized protein n=1 Tax=Patella caerulea TaxID=87958 RepID=A0AAN8JEX2_PATCE
MKTFTLLIILVFQVYFITTDECGIFSHLECIPNLTKVNKDTVCQRLSIARKCLEENGCDIEYIHRKLNDILEIFDVKCDGGILKSSLLLITLSYIMSFIHRL